VAAVEFAAVGGVLMLLVIGIAETGRYLLTLEAVRTAAADAVRLATLRGSANINAGASPCAGLAGSLAGAGTRAPLLRAADLAVTLSGCATMGTVTSVTVTVTYPYSVTVRLPSAGVTELRETAVAVIY
jgi:Flp pilus assembly protein TadG